MKRIFLFVFMNAFLGGLFAQNKCDSEVDGNEKIALQKGNSGHLYADVVLQKSVSAKAMLESGIPYLILDSSFVFQHRDDMNLSLSKSDQKLNLGGKRFKVNYVSTDTVFLNNLMYTGKTFIVNMCSLRADALYPIQLFKNGKDSGSRILELNMADQCVIPLSRTQLNDIKGDFQVFPMNNDGYMNMYAIESDFIVTGESKGSIHGDFLLDLGNAAFLFLLEQSSACQNFIRNSGVKVQQGRNKQGKLIPVKAFYVPECQIADNSFEKVTVAMTDKLLKFTTDGVLGLKFFRQFQVIFDFDQKKLYLKRI